MATTNLPAIGHPLSRLNSPEKIAVRGFSRGEGASSQVRCELEKVSRLRPITADEIPWRLTKSSRGSRANENGTNLPELRTAFEKTAMVKNANDHSKPAIPIFGNRAALASRSESQHSHISIAALKENLTVDEIESQIREKLSSSYHQIKQTFRQYDTEGRGIVTRDNLARIVSRLIGRNLTLSQFNRLMVRLDLDMKKSMSIDEFYAAFTAQAKKQKASELPEWLELQSRTVHNMTASQVHAQLKEKARQRFLDLADLIPQVNPGGNGRLLKPEFRNALNKHGFPMDDVEFEKLWQKYDTENIGVVKGEQLLLKLGISLKTNVEDGEMASRERSPRKLETERQHSLDIERWLKRKFREGCSKMKHAFWELDLDRTGRVGLDDFMKVLKEFELNLSSEKQAEDFLVRCGVQFEDSKVPYKEFLRRFQDRSETGVAHKILMNPLHRYHQTDVDSKDSTTSVVEAKLIDLFQREFLSLLGTLHKIDRKGEGLVTQEQFRAAIESRFSLGMSDDVWKKFLNAVPLDDDGMVHYVQFMSNFDAKEQLSLFDENSASHDEKDSHTRESSSKSHALRAATTPETPVTNNRGKTLEEMKITIRKILNEDLRKVQEVFYEIDEFNTKRFTQDMFAKLLRRFGVEFEKKDIRQLWGTLLTDQKRMLEFSQFIRHFGGSLSDQAYPNAKNSPPRKGDSDFMMRSNKLNSDVDMLYGQLRSNFGLNWGKLQADLKSLDPGGTGYVSKDDLKEIIQRFCVQINDHEAEMIVRKFEGDEERVNYNSLLDQFSRRRHRRDDNMQGIMTQRDYQLQDTRKEKKEPTVRLKEKLSDEWMALRRAFKKLDKLNEGYLNISEFRSVLLLCNVVLSDDEVLDLLTILDDKMQGKINYQEFLKMISPIRPGTNVTHG